MKLLKLIILAGAFVLLADSSANAQTPGPGPAPFSDLKAIGAGIVTMGAAFGIGMLAKAAVENMARQPEVEANIRGRPRVIVAAFIEGFTFFAATDHSAASPGIRSLTWGETCPLRLAFPASSARAFERSPCCGNEPPFFESLCIARGTIGRCCFLMPEIESITMHRLLKMALAVGFVWAFAVSGAASLEAAQEGKESAEALPPVGQTVEKAARRKATQLPKGASNAHEAAKADDPEHTEPAWLRRTRSSQSRPWRSGLLWSSLGCS